MKILRIIARLNIGGPARNAVLLTEGLDKKDFKSLLLCGNVPKGEGDMQYIAKEKGIEPIIVKRLTRELSFKNDWRAFWDIYKIIKKEKPDIIHTHTAKAGVLGRAAGVLYNLISSNKKSKLVHTFHGHVLHSYFGKLKTLFFIWIEKILAFFTDRIIIVSSSLKNELVKDFRIASKEKFSVVELGFELDELLSLSQRENSNSVNIGIIGRLVSVKNHKMLFRIAKNIGNYKVRFVVIGDGGLKNELKSYAKELGIENIVEFKGWIKDLKEIYNMLDIVALTSLNEGTPVSIIEAMAAGKPVVATKVGGVVDIVEEGKSGYLVKADDEYGFKEKLLDLVKDSERRKTFGEYGRKLVKDRFSKKRLIKDMENLYSVI